MDCVIREMEKEEYSLLSDFLYEAIFVPDGTEPPPKSILNCPELQEKAGFLRVEFLTYNEGLCVQCMHIGSYDDEPATVDLMHSYMKENGYELDITDTRYHHEIYLSDPRKCDPIKLKTVVRHPIKKIK